MAVAKRSKQARRRAIAATAARIIAEEGQRDYGAAKVKAAARLGYAADADLPRNTEVEDALREHLALFGGVERDSHLGRLRSAALEAMDFFGAFGPRLVGAVLAGTADRHSAVSLHVFADAPEDVSRFLMDQRIPYDEDSRVVRRTTDQTATLPSFKFRAGDVPIDLTVFPRDHVRQPPLSPIDGKPMARASRAAVEALLS